MKKLIIIFSVLFYSLALSSQSTNWGDNIKRLQKTISEQEQVIAQKTAQIDSLSSNDSISLGSKLKQINLLNREIEEISIDIDVSKSVMKTYQKLLKKEKDDKIIAEKKAKETKEAEEKEAEKERLRIETAKRKEAEFKASIREKVRRASQQNEDTPKESI